MTRARHRGWAVPAAALALALAGCAQVPGDPHGSPAAWASSHLSASAWREALSPRSVSRREALVPVALAAGALVAAPFDDRLERAAEGSLGRAETIGDVGSIGLVATSLVLGAARPGPYRTARDETWTQVEALGLTIGATEALKALVRRPRPDGSGSRSSFPSGHTSAAFCAATLIERSSGPAYGLPAYAVATITGLSRVESGRHFPSDVLAGAALGIAIATLVDALHFGDGRPGAGISGVPVTWTAGPTADGGIEVGLSIDF